MEEENQSQENSVNPVEEQPIEEKPKSKKGLIITTVVLSFLIVGGAVAGYFYITSSATKIDTPTPIVVNDIEEEETYELAGTSYTCNELIDLIKIEPIDFGSSYTKWIDENRYLYFHISDRPAKDFDLYLFEKNKSNDCLTKLDEIRSGGPGGYYDYTPAFTNNSVINISYSDGDIGGFWEDTTYYDLDSKTVKLIARKNSNSSLQFELDGSFYNIDPDISITPSGACNFFDEGNANKDIDIVITDIEVNEVSQNVLPEVLAYTGKSFDDCKPITINSFTVSENLNTAMVSYTLLGNFEIDLKPIYIGREPVITSKFDEIRVYIKEDEVNNYVVINTKGNEEIIDEAQISDDSKIGTLLRFRDPYITPSGRYVVYTAGGWEWAFKRVYDLQTKKLLASFDLGTHTFGFNNDETKLFFCTASEFSGKYEASVYSLPEFSLVKNLHEIYKLDEKVGIASDCTLDDNNILVIQSYCPFGQCESTTAEFDLNTNQYKTEPKPS